MLKVTRKGSYFIDLLYRKKSRKDRFKSMTYADKGQASAALTGNLHQSNFDWLV